MDIILIILQSLWFILPAYFANSSAVFFKGQKPLDAGKKLKDGNRILGDGKTWEGTLGGLLIGTFVGFLQYLIYQKYFFAMSSLNYIQYSIWLGFALSFGAMTGDIFESFIKRRMNFKRGSEIIWDKLDFLIGALVIGYLLFDMFCISLWHIAFLVVFTPFIHRAFNIVAYLLKLKNVSW
ncbi:MAG: CDP-2,3-bis-(O-geranylgeranyl)-sn-glycerol synthase [Candidatus Nanohalarchaeota archaeon]|nr:MAG: CDP-2,3-bis-(O-geranylgeranyl)-sn-glycerol synthase [Candidatus Nanohaloarchaeota archaeon]